MKIFTLVYSLGCAQSWVAKRGSFYGSSGKLAPSVSAGQSVHGFDGLNGARSRAGGKDEVMSPKTLVLALHISNQEPTSSVTDWLI